jgi:hypothetical protein
MRADDETDYFPFTREELSPDVIAVIDALRPLFREPGMSHIDADRTAVLPEGQHGADLVIQHPIIDGLALAIAVDVGEADIYWADVTTLQWKDELDDARPFTQVTVRLSEVGPPGVAAAVRGQLNAELHIVEISQRGKRLVTEIRVPDKNQPGQEHTVWKRRERVPLPLMTRDEHSRRATFLGLLQAA